MIIKKNTDTGKWSRARRYKGKWKYLKIRNFCNKFAMKQKNVKPEHSFFDPDRQAEEDEKRMTPEEREKSRAKRLAKKKFIYEIDGNNYEKILKEKEDDIVLVHSYSQKSGKHKNTHAVRSLCSALTYT